MTRTRLRAATPVLAALLVLPACGGGAGTAAVDQGTITVLAAASLTEAFTELGRVFESGHPGSRVRFSFGSSSTLATQVTSGAPADVFAAANVETMRTVTDARAAADPVDIATNTLELAVPPGNPGRVEALADLADPGLRIALCAEQVPCGAATATVLAKAGVRARPDTLEPDVKAVLQKVVADEVDAGLVYRTDVVAAGDRVEGIEFPEAAQAVNRYPVAVLAQSHDPATAQAFVDLVRSSEGQQVLGEAGFGRP